MEYMSMLEAPGLVGALVELIDDSECAIVKRTIRVFTNVYRHSLNLLAEGKLDPAKYKDCYDDIQIVSSKLIEMLSTADNEGVVIHLVRYLEAAIVSHILSDLSNYPLIATMTAPMLDKGVKALFDFVELPHVGGTSFCVAMRALITVSCHQPKMRQTVLALVEKLLKHPPPNLFDHNVRSFNKTLQRNLLRLLRRAETDSEKHRLVSLMVRVGVSRRKLLEWIPKGSHKRPADFQTTNGSSKRLRPTEDEIIQFQQVNKTPKIIPVNKVETKSSSSSSSPKDTATTSKAVSILDSILSCSSKPSSSFSIEDFKGPVNPKLAAILFAKKKPSPNANNTTDNKSNTKQPKIKFTDRCNLKEKMIYNKLSDENVVDLLLEATSNLPKEKPSYIPIVKLDEQDLMKEKLAILLSQYIPDSECLKYLHFDFKPLNTESPAVEEAKGSVTPVDKSLSTDGPESPAEKSSPSGSSPRDVDMRPVEESSPRDSVVNEEENVSNLDPRLEKQNKLQNVDPRLVTADRQVNGDPPQMNSDPQKLNGDPRKMKSDPRQINSDPPQMNSDPRQMNSNPRMVNGDPRKINADPWKVNGDSRKINADPRQVNPDPWQVNSDPRQVNSYPRQVNSDPRQVNSDPRQVNSDPRKVNSDPRKVNSDPRQVNPDPWQVNPDPRFARRSPPNSSRRSPTLPPMTQRPPLLHHNSFGVPPPYSNGYSPDIVWTRHAAPHHTNVTTQQYHDPRSRNDLGRHNGGSYSRRY